MLTLGACFWLIYKHYCAKKMKSYTFNKFFDNNFEPFILNLIAGMAFALSVSGKIDYQIAGFDAQKLIWFFMGMGGQFIARKIFKQFTNKFNN